MEVEGTRERGRPKRRWKEVINRDIEEKKIDEAKVYNRNVSRKLVENGDPE